MNEAFETYLDRLCLPLLPYMPADEVERIRVESATHLEELWRTRMIECGDPDEALRWSIQRFGAAERVAESHLDLWFASSARGSLLAQLGRRNALSLVLFGQASLVALTLVVLRLYSPPENRPSLDPSLWIAWPRWLPVPDLHPLSVGLYVWVGLAPFLAGSVVGRLAPSKAPRWCALGSIASALLSLGVGIQLLPSLDGVLLSLVQVLHWVPASVAASALTFRWGQRQLRQQLASSHPVLSSDRLAAH